MPSIGAVSSYHCKAGSDLRSLGAQAPVGIANAGYSRSLRVQGCGRLARPRHQRPRRRMCEELRAASADGLIAEV